MAAQSSVVARRPSRQILYELLVVMSLTHIPALVMPELKGIFGLVPLAYLVIEARLRHRSWAELGFKPREFWRALRENWMWVLLVVVVVQLVAVGAALAVYPEFIEHVRSRVPILDSLALLPLLASILVFTLIEELSYRALIQERLSWFAGTPAAIVIAAVIFGLMHISAGDVPVVMVDVGLVIVDGLIYGLIFARGKNVLVAWLAHFLADAVPVLIFVLFV